MDNRYCFLQSQNWFNKIMNSKYTRDTILGGAIIIKQPKFGYRINSDSIFLAAAVPATVNNYILDIGAGTGAISLVLAKRPQKLNILAVENFPIHVKLLKENILINKFSEQISVVNSDISTLRIVLSNKKFNHIVSNPPFYQKKRNQLPTDMGRRVSFYETEVSLKDWIKYCVDLLVIGGSFTLIIPYSRYDEILDVFFEYFFTIRTLNLLPRQGEEPKRVIIQGWLKGEKKVHKLDSLELHQKGSNGFTRFAEDILRRGKILKLAEPLADS